MWVSAFALFKQVFCDNLCAVSKFSVNSHPVSISWKGKIIREKIVNIIKM